MRHEHVRTALRRVGRNGIFRFDRRDFAVADHLTNDKKKAAPMGRLCRSPPILIILPLVVWPGVTSVIVSVAAVIIGVAERCGGDGSGCPDCRSSETDGGSYGADAALVVVVIMVPTMMDHPGTRLGRH